MFASPTHSVRPRRVRGRRRGLASLALLTTLALALVAPAARAQTPPPAAQDEDAKFAEVLKRFDAKRDPIEARLRSLGRQLLTVEEKLSRLREQLRAAEAELAARQAELNAATHAVNVQHDLLHESAAAMYIRGPWSYLDAMLNAQDIGSVVRAQVYSEAVLGDFIHVLKDLESKKQRAEGTHAVALAKATDMRKKTAVVEAEEQKIMKAQQSAFGQRNGLINQLIDAVGGIAELRKRGFDIIIRSYTGTSTKIATALQQAQQGQDVATTGQYILRWPVEEHRITSPYGWRLHPIFGYRSFHTGIDIGSDYGDLITSAADGVVVAVDYMGAYGLTVVIDHGHSIGTVYAHMSRAVVTVGQTVIEGQHIGNVGCSGWCTGPHVHFEILVGSKPTPTTYWL